MANNYFSFKQFKIQQDKCAMKVCTDSCIQGAWTAKHLPCDSKYILDIGTGTGLLSLMIAQNSKSQITAIEIERNAYEQAKENFELSPWAEQIQIHHTALQQFSSTNFYDLIICNPPFYENELQSPNKNRNLALHSTALHVQQLMQYSSNNLTVGGIASVMVPFKREKELLEYAETHQLYPRKLLRIHQTEKHSPFRTIVLFTKQKETLIYFKINIKENHSYTTDFIQLMQAYYLHL